MPDQPETLGGRLPLLNPQNLTDAQLVAYNHIGKTYVPWAASVPFQSKTNDGRYIGPFNPVLYSPEISLRFFAWQEAEGKYTTLSERVREVVILTVGAVWKSHYELYAHSAAARKAGISEEDVRTLVSGGLPESLSEPEKIAQRYVWQLTTEHRVDEALYRAAEQTFGRQGLMDIAHLAGAYYTTCALLNAFEVPVPDQPK